MDETGLVPPFFATVGVFSRVSPNITFAIYANRGSSGSTWRKITVRRFVQFMRRLAVCQEILACSRGFPTTLLLIGVGRGNSSPRPRSACYDPIRPIGTDRNATDPF